MTAPTTWVLLRGLTREARHWHGLAERLAAAAPSSRVLAVDLPGTGRARALRSPWSVHAIAQHVRATLADRGAAPPYAVLALSMGGMVATAWACARPDEIDAAVLINTSLRPFSPPWHRLRPAAYGGLLAAACASAADSERSILQLTSRVRAHDTALTDEWAHLRRERPMRRIDMVAQLAAAARFRAPRRNPFAQVLLLASVHDALVDPLCTTAIGAAWGCEVRSHPNAGHDLALDDPDWVVTQATSFRQASARRCSSSATWPLRSR